LTEAVHFSSEQEGKKIRRLGLRVSLSTENKTHSPPLHEEPGFKQRGDSLKPSSLL